MTKDYIGRFAPSPTGLLHAGSLVAALASFIDAKAHHGQWLIRIEDVDESRCKKEWADGILSVLEQLEMKSDGPILWQSQRKSRYAEILQSLIDSRHAYGCSCTRHSIEENNRQKGLPLHYYPGICRNGTHGRPARSLRIRTSDEVVGFTDRRCGSFSENLERDVGDFVIKRADGLWAYQLAVVVDDAEQGITDVVRGEDLLDNTPRQIFLQRKLGYPTPQYLHIALALDGHGQKLSKQTHAPAIDNEDPLELLNAAAIHLGLGSLNAKTPQAFYAAAQEYWAEKYLY